MPNIELNEKTRASLKLIEERVAQYSKCELTFSFVKNNGDYKVCNGVIVFFHIKDKIPEARRLTYDNLVLDRQIVDAKKGIEAVKKLVEEGIIIVPGLGEFKIEANSISDVSGRDYTPAYQSYGYAYGTFSWPSRRIEYLIKTGQVGFSNIEIVSVESPLYPSAGYAIADFMKGSYPSNPIMQKIEIIIPDYRARIKKARILENKIKFEIEDREIKVENLLFKYFIESDSGIISGSSPIESAIALVECPENLTFLEAVILDTAKNDAIDTKYLYPFRLEPWQEVDPEAYGLFVERSITDGENYKVEFKSDIKNSGEFLETISSFSNAKGGMIILGVTDNAEIKGFETTKDRITNIIASNCEPYPKFEIKEIKIGQIPLTIVDVGEGSNKPYSIKERGIFIRKNGTDRQITRGELDELERQRGSTGAIA